MSDKKERLDGIDVLCIELYGRKSSPADWMSGHNGRMLFDAASKIAEVKELNKGLEKVIFDAMLHGRQSDHADEAADGMLKILEAPELGLISAQIRTSEPVESRAPADHEAKQDECPKCGIKSDMNWPWCSPTGPKWGLCLGEDPLDYQKDCDGRSLPRLAFDELVAAQAEVDGGEPGSRGIKVETEVIRDPESPGCGTVMFRITVDGCVVASASADKSHMSNARLLFGKGRGDVCDELKSALRNRLRGVLKRFTVVDCAPGKGDGIWIGRILIMQSDHIEPHCVSYDFSTGETGPESMCEVARNAFRRHIHERVLKSLDESRPPGEVT